MKVKFFKSEDEFAIIEQRLPIKKPITLQQQKIWESFWGMNQVAPFVTYRHDYNLISSLMKEVIDSAKKCFYSGFRPNACLLLDLSRNRVLAKGEDEVRQNDLGIRHAVMVLMENLSKMQKQEQEEQFQKQQYFAKDKILIIAQEPCIMCAMALVHSRISMVYYCFENLDKKGGLNERLQINSLEQLNHRYPAFYNVQIDYARENLLKFIK